ncbi:suppressor APC domain-containing protein 2-like [Rhinoraja longicauda]
MPVSPAYTIIIIPLHSREEARNFYLWLRQMKELEQQRDALWHGLDAVDRARRWYHRELHALHDRQQRGGCGRRLDNDHTSDSSPNHVNLLLDKIQRVNLSLGNFISCAEQALPPHDWAAVSRQTRRWRREDETEKQQRAVAALKRQNHLLSKEASRKSQWISQLEKERRLLLQQLLDIHLQG